MPDHNAAFAATLIDALHRLGVEHACITPGSRNTPLSLALVESAIKDWSHHDERSSAFFALGIARTTGKPAVIVTTSGTAAAELHPALAEAIEGRVPLIAITADRPLRVRRLGAPQTIDQENLFGPSVKLAIDLAVPEDASSAMRLASQLVTAATAAPAGPVHLNLCIDEPLMPTGMVAATRGHPPTVGPDPDPDPDPKAIAATAARVSGRRGVIMAGPGEGGEVAVAAAQLAAALGWPILADPLSGLRAGSHDLSRVLVSSDALGWAGFLAGRGVEAVIRFGAIPTSKPCAEWLAAHPALPQVFIEPAGRRDPTATANPVLRFDIAATLRALAATGPAAAPSDWLEQWRSADSTAEAAINRVLASAPFPNEPAIARTVTESLPDPSVLWVSSSMPVRDVDAMMVPTAKSIRVLANRGANGIDGFLSTAFGSAVVSGIPTVALAGDLSVLHDIGALATAARLRAPATVVVVNNNGGGIFHLLPQAGHPSFERHWGTPHGLDFAAVANAFGVEAEVITDRSALTAAVGATPDRPRLVELRTDREENAALHRLIHEAVSAAIS